MDKVTRKLLNILEDLLVKEFRSSQALYNLEREEQATLLERDIPELAMLVKNREVLLIELDVLANAQNRIVSELIPQLGLSIQVAYTSHNTCEAGYTPFFLDQFFAASDPEIGRRFERLREGIFILLGKVSELSRCNRTLAAQTLSRDDHLQAGLLDHYLAPQSFLTQTPPVLAEQSLVESTS